MSILYPVVVTIKWSLNRLIEFSSTLPRTQIMHDTSSIYSYKRYVHGKGLQLKMFPHHAHTTCERVAHVIVNGVNPTSKQSILRPSMSIS